MMDTATAPAPAPCFRVSPDVVQQALQLAGGDRGRLEVVGPDAVLVRNRPRR